MTRNEQLKKEEEIIEKFLEYLSEKGFEVKREPEKMESPDFRLFIDNKRVGCELTRITLESVEKWARGQLEETEEMTTEIMTNTTGKWMENALFKKIKKVPKYKENCKCDELWLLIHFGIVPLFGHDKDNFERMKKAIKRSKHQFDKIWFVGSGNDIRLLWEKEV